MRRAFARTLLPAALLGVLGVSARAFAADTLVVKWNDKAQSYIHGAAP